MVRPQPVACFYNPARLATSKLTQIVEVVGVASVWRLSDDDAARPGRYDDNLIVAEVVASIVAPLHGPAPGVVAVANAASVLGGPGVEHVIASCFLNGKTQDVHICFIHEVVKSTGRLKNMKSVVQPASLTLENRWRLQKEAKHW